MSHVTYRETAAKRAQYQPRDKNSLYSCIRNKLLQLTLWKVAALAAAACFSIHMRHHTISEKGLLVQSKK